MRPSWCFVAFARSAGEEYIIEIGVIDMEFMWADPYDWAVCSEEVLSERLTLTTSEVDVHRKIHVLYSSCNCWILNMYCPLTPSAS
jgi:hypothetical protein